MNSFLLVGATLSAVAALVHVTIVVTLCLITAIYLLRGFAGFVLLITPSFSKQKLTSTFLVVSSVICLVYEAVHLVGLVQVWDKI
jgi:hypothetical protein